MSQLLSLIAAGVGLLLAIGSIKYPRLGITLLLLLTPLEVVAWGEGANIRLYQPLTVLCVFSWIGTMAFFKRPFVYTPTFRAMLVWTLCSIPSIVNSPATWDWVQIFAVQVFMLVLVGMVTSLINTWGYAKSLMTGYIVVSLLVGIFSLIQTVLALVFHIYLGLTERQTAYLFFYNRPSGTFEEPNWLAAYLVAPALFFFTFLVSRKEPLPYKRSFLTAGLLITVMAIFMTQTRSSFIGLAFGLGVVLFLNSGRFTTFVKRSIQVAFSVGLIAMLVALIIPKFVTNLDSASNGVGILMRTNSWIYAWELAWQHPVIGNGLGAWAYYFSLLVDTLGKIMGGRIVPNAFLGVFFETGLFGLVSFVYLIIVIIRDVLSTIKRLPSDAIVEELWLKAFLAGFMGLMVNFAFTNAIRYGFFWLFIALGVSMVRCIRLTNLTVSPKSRKSKQRDIAGEYGFAVNSQ